MARVNRETVRDYLATLLETALVDGGTQYAQAVYNYQHPLSAGLSPVVMVMSGGTDRQPVTFQGGGSTFLLWIRTYVAQVAEDWTEAQAEDRLDKLEAEIAQVVEDNRNTPAYWTHITYAGQSSVQPVEISGVPYITEAIPIRVEVLS